MVFQRGVAANPGGVSKMPKKLRELCKARTKEAVDTLSEIMNDASQPGPARVTAATALMDRAWGRPQASLHVETEVKTTFIDVLRRAAEIEKEREAEAAQMIDITPDPNTISDV
jgi:hypothetical protein